MYLLVESKGSETHEIIICDFIRGITRRIDDESSEQWELIGIQMDDSEIHIATFNTEYQAYSGLRQLLDVITREDSEWDVVAFKHQMESLESQADPDSPF